MKTKFLTFSVLSILVFSFAIFSFTIKPDVKIAYVRSAELIDGYQGMMDARTAYQDKTLQWQAEIDSVKRAFNDLPKTRKEMPELSVDEWQRYEQSLHGRHYQIQQMEQVHQRRLTEEDRKLTQAVLDQVNSFTESYAKDKGYTLVLGTTQNGNILYGEEQYDITEDLLDALNHHYSN